MPIKYAVLPGKSPAGDELTNPVDGRSLVLKEGEKRAYIVVGSIHHINGILGKNPDARFIYLEMPPDLIFGRQNSVYIEISSLPSPLPYTIRSLDGDILAEGEVSYDRLFNGMLFHTGILPKLNTGGPFFREEETPAFVPLFYISYTARPLAVEDGMSGELAEDISLYSQLRYCESDIIFIRTALPEYRTLRLEGTTSDTFDGMTSASGFRLPEKPGDPLLLDCIDLHEKDSLFLGNHQCYYRKMESEYEIEYKLNLDSPTRIWDLTVELYHRVKEGLLEGYILEYKDEFQKWDYYNHLFEVTGPEEEVGYISFIPRTNGNYNVKRKVYKQDDLKRKELIKSNVRIDGSLEEYLSRNYPVTFRSFPPFRRVRYDINFESLATGNVFGIFFDHVTVEGRDECLIQCELEYLRTRSLFNNDRHAEELKDIYDWTLAFLDEKGIRYKETFYSKLSFLRDIFKGTS